jgi:hypothetical protein
MTLDESIKWYKDKEVEYRDLAKEEHKNFAMIAEEYQQFAEWLTELKEAKRLLKLALNDFETIESNLEYDEHCVIKTHSIRCDECPLSAETIYRCKWRHADEALALIGEDGDTE